jgi:FkbM family methyltransferase
LIENYSIFEENIKLNNIKNITLNKYVISDNKCKMTFSHGTSKICEDGNINVDNIELDEYVNKNKIDKIKLIKIDVEGHEINVLQTMKNILDNNVIEYIMCEVTNKTYLSVYKILFEHGYNKIYNLNTGFIFNKYHLNSSTFLNLKDILINYELKNISPENCNLLFCK